MSRAAPLPPMLPGYDDFAQRLREKLQGAERVFVLGIGTDWKSDDRVGTVLARALARKLGAAARIRVASGGEAPENFTGAVRRFAPSHVVILDAVDHGLKPGTAFVAEERQIAVGDMTSHHLPLKLLMRFLRKSIPCQVVLVGVQPRNLLPGKRLSAPVRRTVAPLADFLATAIGEALEEKVQC
ncbi:MAG: hydrogenase 3 maturation endopeptidase HyCI [Candidatus Aminicenantes bacterium]|nr:hydrogenase 3 maturation endopeptidase HyCI [Candidatus Aminicenantes bacterium]